MKEEVEKIVERIVENSELGKDEVVKKIDEKEKEYSGLISKEGAAHIIAKDAGVQLMDDENKALDIKNIVSGMNSVTVTGKIQRIFDTREFETEDRKGKVANVILADETGTVRISFWNEEVEKLIDEGKIKEGDVIRIVNGYVKKDNRGNPELRLGRSGQVEKSDEEINVAVSSRSGGRSKISELTPGERGEIRGTLVNLYTKKPFFKTCPECNKRVEDKCEEHDKYKVNLAISGVMDDGTGSIRSVFFREQAEKLLGMKTEEVWKKSGKGKSMEKFAGECEGVLGREFRVQGRVKINDFFGSPEFIANEVQDVDPKEEAQEVLSSL